MAAHIAVAGSCVVLVYGSAIVGFGGGVLHGFFCTRPSHSLSALSEPLFSKYILTNVVSEVRNACVPN